MQSKDVLVHPFSPIYDNNSRILILGTMPSVASRQNQFYYGHPQNRFWKVLAAVTETVLPETIQEKKNFLLSQGIALWDVLASCRIELSKDSSIKEPVVNSFDEMLKNTRICAIYTNGRKAGSLYKKLAFPQTRIESTVLPSTSPANAQYGLEKLMSEWTVIRKHLI